MLLVWAQGCRSGAMWPRLGLVHSPGERSVKKQLCICVGRRPSCFGYDVSIRFQTEALFPEQLDASIYGIGVIKHVPPLHDLAQRFIQS